MLPDVGKQDTNLGKMRSELLKEGSSNVRVKSISYI